MSISECNISIEGLKLNSKATQSIHSLLRILKRKSPSNSYLSLRLVSGEQTVDGFLSITSTHYQFNSSFCGIDPVSVTTQMNSDLLEKLQQWIRGRDFKG